MCCTQIGLTPFLLEKSNEARGIVNSCELCICASALDNKVWPSILKQVFVLSNVVGRSEGNFFFTCYFASI